MKCELTQTSDEAQLVATTTNGAAPENTGTRSPTSCSSRAARSPTSREIRPNPRALPLDSERLRGIPAVGGRAAVATGSALAFVIELTGSSEERFGIGMWYHWGQIAIRHEAAAWEARRAAGSWSDPELKAVMVSVASAGFAVDSFSASIKALIGEPASDKKKHRPRLKELFRRSGMFIDQASLSKDVDWLIGGRDLLVHNGEGPHTPSRFEEHAVYHKAEAATRAVDIMLRILGTSIRAPRPTFAEWARSPVRAELLRALENERVPLATSVWP